MNARPRKPNTFPFSKKAGREGRISAIIERDGDACAICGVSGSVEPLNLDHCHEHGHDRGMLCRGCNVGLGLFNDDPEWLRRAADYVEEHRG